MVHGPKAGLMVALLLWKLATLTTVRLLIWDGSQSTGDHGTVLLETTNGHVVGAGSMGMLAVGRAINANADIFPRMIGDIAGDRGNIRVLWCTSGFQGRGSEVTWAGLLQRVLVCVMTESGCS